MVSWQHKAPERCKETNLPAWSGKKAEDMTLMRSYSPDCSERILARAVARSLFFCKLCSQILTKRIPCRISALETYRARRRFAATLAFQYFRFPLGRRRQRGHPCQKHPSTKTATRRLGNQKSGCPGMERGCIRQPLIPDLTRVSLNCFSVERLPVDRTFDIKALRSSFVRVSIRNSSEIL